MIATVLEGHAADDVRDRVQPRTPRPLPPRRGVEQPSRRRPPPSLARARQPAAMAWAYPSRALIRKRPCRWRSGIQVRGETVSGSRRRLTPTNGPANTGAPAATPNMSASLAPRRRTWCGWRVWIAVTCGCCGTPPLQTDVVRNLDDADAWSRRRRVRAAADPRPRRAAEVLDRRQVARSSRRYAACWVIGRGAAACGGTSNVRRSNSARSNASVRFAHVSVKTTSRAARISTEHSPSYTWIRQLRRSTASDHIESVAIGSTHRLRASEVPSPRRPPARTKPLFSSDL